MTYTIKHQLHIEAPQNQVFKAISSIKGLSNWWTVQTQGDEGLGAHVVFDFGDYTGPEMKVIDHLPPQKLVWQCLGRVDGWIGHIYTFSLSEAEGKTLLQFSHGGWQEQGDFFAHCNFSWGRYLESLRQYCQTGKGEAFGSPGYRQSK